jgi:uncharacterized repeat protein (TIGR03803 family)
MKTFWTVIFLAAVQTAMAQMWGVTPAGGAQAAGAIYETNLDGTGFNIVSTFSVDPSGAFPEGGHLVQHTNGNLYGTTFGGGVNGAGVILEFDPSDGSYTKVFDFEGPVTGNQNQNVMIMASNNKMYGVSFSGGSNGVGTFWEFDPAGPTFTKRHDFLTPTTGSNPDGNLVEVGGKIYGTTNGGGTTTAGTIFEFDPGTNSLTNRYNFVNTSNGSGRFPRGLTAGTDGKIYGTAAQGGAAALGTIFSFDPTTSSYAARVSFASPATVNGSLPQSTLVEHTNGMFYGVTSSGGTNSRGVFYEFNPGTNALSVKYHFDNASAMSPLTEPVLGTDGKIYGTVGSGDGNRGIIYSYVPGTNTFTVVKSFNLDGSEGSLATALIEESAGKFYGLARNGGANGVGILYEFLSGTSAFTIKHDFVFAPGGASPNNGLTLAPDGKFYGVTQQGGTSNDGTIFEFDPATDNYTKKADFSAPTTGSSPQVALTVHGNGKLYGMTNTGGLDNFGVLYEFDPSTSALTKKADLSSVGGRLGDSPFLLGEDGKLYGFTKFGGAGNFGTMISFDPKTGSLANLPDFDNTNTGRYPFGLLAWGPDGKMYGTVQQGGTNNFGVIFEFNPADGILTKKLDIPTAVGGNPTGLIAGSNGNFYGITSTAGTTGSGGIFEYDLGANTAVQVEGFTTSTPTTTLLHSTNGKVYGASNNTTTGGKLFEYDYVNDVFTNRYNFVAGDGTPTNTSLAQRPVNQTIYFNDITKNIAEGTFDLEGMSTAGLPLTYVSADPGIASIVGKTVTLHTEGTVDITASQAGTASVNAAADVVATLTINNVQSPQTITFPEIGGKTFGDGDFALAATASSGLTVSYASSNLAVATVTGATVTIVGAGTTTITATQGGNASFLAADPVDRALVVAKAAQTITFPEITEKNTDSPDFDLGATASSGLAVTYQTSNAAIVTITGSMADIVGPGTATITAMQAGNDNYNAATNFPRVFLVKGTQTITFAALDDRTILDEPFELTATASSGLPVSYSSSNTAVATVSGSTVTIVGLGSTQITATQAGDAEFVAAPSVEQTLNVVKVPQTITFAVLEEKFINDAPFNLTATSTSGLSISYASSNTAVATVSGSTVTIIGIGTTTITASQAGNGTYAAATSVDRTLSVVKVPQTITFAELDEKLVNDDPFALTATSTSGLTVTYASSNLAVATVTGSTVTIVGVGSTTITASQAGNGMFAAAASVDRTLSVVKVPQTINFAELGEKSDTDPPFGLTATASSGLAVTYSSSNTAVATVSGATVTIVGLGTTTITASQAGDATYAAATSVDRDLTIVAKTSQTITFNALPDKTYGDAPFALSATATSGLTVSFESSNTAVATVSGTTVTIVGGGTTVITARQAGDATFAAAAPVDQTLEVLKAAQAITFASIPDKTPSSAPFDLEATASSGLPVTYLSSDPSVATVSGSTVTIVGVGTTTILAEQFGDNNYEEAVSVPRSLVVKSDQTITFGALPDKTFGDAAFALTATASSSLAVSYSSSNTAVATVSGSTVTIVGAGETTITATQAGNATFIAAVPVVQTLTVLKADQTITFDEITTKTAGGSAFAITATASSALPITFTSSDEVTIGGTTVTIVKAGSAEITATQPGNENYNPASSVTHAFCVNPAKPTITAAGENTSNYVLTSSATEGNQWYADGAAITGATNATLTLEESGLYKVQATVEGCVGEFSDEYAAVVVGLETRNSSLSLKLYPSPASDKVMIEAPCQEGCRVSVMSLDSRMVEGFDMKADQQEVDVRGFAHGLYVIRVATADGVMMGKFIRQ